MQVVIPLKSGANLSGHSLPGEFFRASFSVCGSYEPKSQRLKVADIRGYIWGYYRGYQGGSWEFRLWFISNIVIAENLVAQGD